MPLVTGETFERSFAAREAAGMAIVAFRSASKAYGRVVTDRDGMLARIVEYKDANEDERKVDLCNAGIMAAEAKSFFRWAAQLKNENAQKEYYLTDVPAIAKADRVACAVVEADEGEMMGVNSAAANSPGPNGQCRCGCARRARCGCRHDCAGNGFPEPRHPSRGRCAGGALRRVRAGRDSQAWRGDQGVLASRRRGRCSRRAGRPLCAAPARRE